MVQPFTTNHGLAAHPAFQVGARDYPAQVAIAAVVLAEHDEREWPARVVRIRDTQVRADDGLDAARDGTAVKLHEPEQVVFVGHRDRRHAVGGGFRRQRRNAHRAVHEGILGVDVQMYER